MGDSTETDTISAEEFSATADVSEWHPADGTATAVFRTGSFARGVDFVDLIGELADAADHHPDVDLRYPSVTVRLSSHDIGGLSRRDAALARAISDAARSLGVEAETDEG
ncbi:4a-hydroxytetrahydrobiopterin dehydratase [Labedella endophytica]|uniref:Putative pterin-4-alpha-carbinolamine dehydratase n=1 Tax=Labedella endophytica TaxID=1523160 RepID=A0A3S0XZX6_9MICO|nr:4a-hydroxytetrahydrobiopterin dehydratase [Labedella endophytica]RUR00946.1 4a-hydroxytetrahydrobiopterin dehydratase [Labedella endophytica]